MSELPSARELLHIQLHTMHRMDALGLLLPPAPRLFIVRNPEERLLRIRQDVPELTARALLAAASDDELRERVSRDAPIEREYHGPAFLLPPQVEVSGDVVELGIGAP